MTLELGRAVPCDLSFLAYIYIYIYYRELGKAISNCVHGVRYLEVGKDDVLEWKSQERFLYAGEMCLMASSIEDMKVIMK